jgi:hypothetical protein
MVTDMFEVEVYHIPKGQNIAIPFEHIHTHLC